MQSFKILKMVSIFLVFLLVFSLVAPPLQLVGYAEAEVEVEELVEEQDTTEEVSTDEVEVEGNNSADKSGEATEESTEQTESTVEDEEVIEEENSNEESEDLEVDYSDFEMEINEVTTTSNSITIKWSTNQDIVEDFELLVNDESVGVVPGDVKSYTFTDLNLGEYYDIAVSAKINNDYIYSFHISETPYWSDEELIPVSIITMLNEDPYNEKVRIRGLEKSNKAFNSTDWISSGDGDLRMPLGKFDVTIYDYNDPSISAVETIEIKEGIDYINNPIQLKFRLKEMREEAEPFKFEVTNVTENSYSLNWNQVSKITGFEITTWDSITGEHYYESGLIDKDATEYKVTGLNPDLIYSVNLIGNYLYDLDYTNYFKIKTLGEDAKAPKVNFEDKAFYNQVASELGVFLRDVTEADMNDLTSITVEHGELDSLDGIQYANNLEDFYAYGNKISSIENLTELSELRYLELGGNKVSDISSLKSLNKLYNLSLYSNEITNIEDLASLSKLEYLNLNSNKISNVSALKGLNKLNNLSLASNEITDVEALENLFELNYLRLDNNKISNILALKGLNKLTSLSLSSNEITNIDSLENLSQLEYLSIGYNRIYDLSALKGLNNLIDLSLSSNEITDVRALANLSELEHLSLGYNKISNISELKGLNKLTNLYLSSNEITDITSLAGLKSLEHLDLDYNQITDITALRKLPKLQSVSLYGMGITDEETIQYLRNEGVEVNYDGDNGDWNDWDDEETDEEENPIIDREEVIKSFPEEQGFVVSEDGKSITLDLNKQTSSETFELSTEQTKMLIENNQTLNLAKDDVQTSFPASSFDKNNDEPVKININELKGDPKSFSSTYDFTVKQGTRTISQFEEGVTLTFNVNSERAKDPNNLKVFYFNEETKEWEKVGGTYSNGKVTVVTYHFSKFTVFEEEVVIDKEPMPEEGFEETDTEAPTKEPSDSNEIDDEEIAPSDTNVQPSDSDEVSEEEVVIQKPGETNNQSPGSEKETPEEKVESDSSENGVVLEQDQSAKTEAEVKTKVQKKSDESNKLPKTATSLYTKLLIGTLFLITGLIFYLVNRRKARFN